MSNGAGLRLASVEQYARVKLLTCKSCLKPEHCKHARSAPVFADLTTSHMCLQAIHSKLLNSVHSAPDIMTGTSLGIVLQGKPRIHHQCCTVRQRCFCADAHWWWQESVLPAACHLPEHGQPGRHHCHLTPGLTHPGSIEGVGLHLSCS